MTDVTTGEGQEPAELSAADEQVLRELTERARTGGLKLTGEGGLLGRLTKMVVEAPPQPQAAGVIAQAAGRTGDATPGHPWTSTEDAVVPLP